MALALAVAVGLAVTVRLAVRVGLMVLLAWGAMVATVSGRKLLDLGSKELLRVGESSQKPGMPAWPRMAAKVPAKIRAQRTITER